MRQSLLNDVSIHELQQLRDSGMNNRQIAERLDVSAACVSKYLPSEHKKYVRLDNMSRMEIVDLYKKGETVKKLSDTFNINISTVYKILKEAGIYRRKTIEKKNYVKEPSMSDEPAGIESCTGKLVRKEVGQYIGWQGEYTIDFTNMVVELPAIKKQWKKEELGEYIRDLMSVWREMKK